MRGKLATIIDRIEHGHHIFRAYFKHDFPKQYEKFATFLRNQHRTARRHADPAEPIVGYWSRAFIGWAAYHEPVPLIRHDVAGWEPIVDQAAARAVPLEKPRRPAATTVVVGEAKAPRRLAAPTRRQVRKPTLIVGR